MDKTYRDHPEHADYDCADWSDFGLCQLCFSIWYDETTGNERVA